MSDNITNALPADPAHITPDEADSQGDLRSRADVLYRAHINKIHSQTDRLFAGLMLFQWVGCVIAAMVIAPRTWIGLQSYTNSTVWAAVLLGGAITIFL